MEENAKLEGGGMPIVLEFVVGERGVKGDIGPAGPAGPQGEKGEKGEIGKTPVKGVDYYTENEKQDFSNALNQQFEQEKAERNVLYQQAEENRDSQFAEAEAGRDAMVEGKVGDITRLQGEVAKKANIDGYYSSMVVGAAESLIGQNVTTQQFTYQPSGNNLDVQDGLAVVKSIKGNTVVANQLFKENLYNPISTINISDNNGVFTVNGSTDATNSIYLDNNYTLYKEGDKVLILYPHNKPNPYDNFILLINRQGESDYQTLNDTDRVIFTIKTTEDLRPTFPCVANQPYEDIQFSLKIINLTQMFGAGNEPNTAEEFERLYFNLPKDYNEGSLLNINADSIKSVGFNRFDKNTAQREAYIDSTTLEVISYRGLKESVSSYIRVIPNETYYVKNAISSYHRTVVLYDKDKKIAGRMLLPHGSTIDKKHLSKGLVTIPENVYYIRFGVYDEYLDSCVFNLSHSGYRNGEYEPYNESIVNLPIKKYFPDGMKSAGEVRDEIVWDEGLKKYKIIQRVGSVDMGTLPYGVDNSGKFYLRITNKNPGSTGNIDVLCSKYISKSSIGNSGVYTGEGSCIWSETNTKSVFIQDDNFTDYQVLKESLAGQILYYKLETPIETIIDDYDLIDYEVSDFGTEEIITDEPTTPIVIEVVYGVNAVDALRRLPQNYMSTDSMRDFLAQLGSAMNGNWAMTFDEVNNKWLFAFAANVVVNNEE